MRNREIKKIILIGAAVTLLMTLAASILSGWGGLFCLVLGGTLTVIFLRYTRKRYRRMEELNGYLGQVLSGDYALPLEENEEGELSILQNNLYKVIVLLQTQNEELKKDKVYLAEALADISHQLKTPLTSLKVMTEVLKEEDLGEKNQFVRIMETQTEKMNWLVLNLLKISKLDAKTAGFKNDTVDVREMLTESLRSFLIQIDLRQIRLSQEGESFMFIGDKKWTAEAFANIFKNCLEHMEDGGQLKIILTPGKLYGTVVVEDDGCGIAKEDLPHIFERFYHGKNAAPESAGIGLALAKTVLEKERSKITVTSEEGKGTRFEIRFYHRIV